MVQPIFTSAAQFSHPSSAQPYPLHELIDKDQLTENELKQNRSAIENEKEKVTPLLHALTTKKFDAAKVLIEGFANVRAIDGVTGETCLHLACESQNASMVKLLLIYGADVNVKASGMTPLFQAAQLGNAEIVRMLLEYLPRCNELNGPNNDTTALDAACFHGFKEVA